MFSTFTPPWPEMKVGAKRRFDAQLTSRPSGKPETGKGEPGTRVSAPFEPILNMAKPKPSWATARNLRSGETFMLIGRSAGKGEAWIGVSAPLEAILNAEILLDAGNAEFPAYRN